MNNSYIENLLSIIIPVYNSDKYLTKCLESIAQQTYTNLEVILIDDGSTDDSAKICNEFCAKDSRFVVYHVENGGPSKARNLGLSKMKGQYLAFVDSDDYLSTDMYEKLIEGLKNTNCGMIIENWMIYDERINTVYKSNIEAIHPITSAELKELIFLFNEKAGGGYPWNRVIDLSRVNDTTKFKEEKFVEGLSAYEDKCWLIDILSYIDTVAFMPENYGYQYIIRGTSLSRKNCLNKSKQVLIAYDHMIDNMQIHNQLTYTVMKAYNLSFIGMFMSFCSKDRAYVKQCWPQYRKKIDYKTLRWKDFIKIAFIEINCFI